MMRYYHVDVFSNKPYSGNGLTVFTEAKGLQKSDMQAITQEMRQFESIFLEHLGKNEFRAFIFTMEEELDFAGHPVIGAAALMHDLYSGKKHKDDWTIQLNSKSVGINTVRHENYYSAQMNQGKAEFGTVLSNEQEIDFLSYFSLDRDDRASGLPFQVISTGLPYLILPVKSESLSKTKVSVPDLNTKLEKIGAKFFYVLDVDGLQGRTWDNFGLVEDIATGSAAGPVGAYLVRNRQAAVGKEIIIKQGDFVGRPSKMNVIVSQGGDILVAGNVCKIAIGELLV